MTCFLRILLLPFVFFSLALHGQQEIKSAPEKSESMPITKRNEPPPFPEEKVTQEKMAKNPIPSTHAREEMPGFSPFENEQQEEIANNSRFMTEFMKMLFYLGLIIVFMLIGSYSLKRMMSTRVQQANEQSTIKILEQRTLSAKTTVYLLNIKEKEILIVEASSGAISFLPLSNEK